jgi:hypothetical protein
VPARLLPELSTEQPWQEDEATENSQPPPHRLASFGSAPPDRQRACSCRVASLGALRSESGRWRSRFRRLNCHRLFFARDKLL